MFKKIQLATSALFNWAAVIIFSTMGLTGFALYLGYNSKLVFDVPLPRLEGTSNLRVELNYQRDPSQPSQLDEPNALECQSLEEVE